VRVVDDVVQVDLSAPANADRLTEDDRPRRAAG
jgi:hypothetical protein